MKQTMTPRLWAVLLLTAALFGSSFLFIKLTVESIPPITLAAGRASLAALAVYFFMRLSGERMPSPGKAWQPIIVLGVLTAIIPYIAIAYGQTHIASSLGGILFATIPVFSVLIAPTFLPEEHLTKSRLFGVALGFAGVVLAIGPSAFSHLDTQLAGAGVTVLAALSYATGNIFARANGKLQPVVLASGQLIVAALVLTPLSMIFDRPWALSPGPSQLGTLIVVALFNTAVPVMLMFWLIRNAGASNASLLAFFMPVASVLLGVFVLAEGLSWTTGIGFALIVLGAVLVTGSLSLRRSFQRA
ncbi:EamA family transporter [Roseibium porphyridii]|uniref:EamA family transporter n=1 Tax=Roseibium porphyridii TaxID=2866279 RepID=A0ABY8F653_9HYPH|nr:EamA family transporter [Roseibium sp. KMA01]WFE90967.1 EamA family transporter [Roseibium sp. KMA01]